MLRLTGRWSHEGAGCCPSQLEVVALGHFTALPNQDAFMFDLENRIKAGHVLACTVYIIMSS